MDLSNLTVAELRELQQRIPAELTRREQKEKTEVLNELRAIAKTRGYSIEELMAKEARQPLVQASKVKPKYRHPENQDLEWTGRGRKPKWVEAWLAAGNAIEGLAI